MALTRGSECQEPGMMGRRQRAPLSTTGPGGAPQAPPALVLVYLVAPKSPIFVHDTLFTCHSFSITGYDSFSPGRAKIAAGEAQARTGGAEPPHFNHGPWCDEGDEKDRSSQLAMGSGRPGGLGYDLLRDVVVRCGQRTRDVW